MAMLNNQWVSGSQGGSFNHMFNQYICWNRMCLKRMSCDTRVADAETFFVNISVIWHVLLLESLFSWPLLLLFFLRFPSHLFSSHPMSSHLIWSHLVSSHPIWCFLISSLFYSDCLNFSQFMSSHFCVSLMGFLQTETWWDSWLSKIKHGKWESRILWWDHDPTKNGMGVAQLREPCEDGHPVACCKLDARAGISKPSGYPQISLQIWCWYLLSLLIL